ncbi:tetratricopeptide repeat protein [Candidatus Riflebacteria bacterium]
MNKTFRQKCLKLGKVEIITHGYIFTLLLFIQTNLLFPLHAEKENKESAKAGIKFEDFVGSKACQECHQAEYDLWEKSTHRKAGGSPAVNNVISDFNGTVLKFTDATVQLSVNTKKEFIVTVKIDGNAEQVFKVDAIIGGGYMVGGGGQCYFTKYPDGTLRLLPFEYARIEKLWYAQQKNSEQWVPITPEMSIYECTNWPPFKILGEHYNFDPGSCGSCHGSQIQVKFLPEKEKYSTRFVSLGINCESCHGPGKKHIELAKSNRISHEKDIGLEALDTLNKDASLNICFRCHAIKLQIFDFGNYLPGKSLEKYFSKTMDCAFINTFLPDGRIRKFAYQKYHLYSDCYLSGSMTCVDCHNPHSQKYRDIWGKELVGIFDDEQCLSCHMSKKPAIEKHSHHIKGSKGSLCISCHMPYVQHPVIGPHLKLTRSDHTIPIPRPRFDSSQGVENACYKCHKDRKTPSLQEITDEWYAQLKPHKPIIKAILNSQKFTNRKIAAEKLLDDSYFHPIAMLVALKEFLTAFSTPDTLFPELETIEKLMKMCGSSELDIKAIAMAGLLLKADNDPKIDSYLRELLRKVKAGDPVRYRIGFFLEYMASRFFAKGNIDRGRAILERAVKINPEDAFLHFYLGRSLMDSGESQKAIALFQKAIAIKPQVAMFHQAMADVLNNSGRIKQAIYHLKKLLSFYQDNNNLRQFINHLENATKRK